MKKYFIVLIGLFVFMVMPFWIGQASPINDVDIHISNQDLKFFQTRISNRINHNTELIVLDKLVIVKNNLKDSILSLREIQIDAYRKHLGYFESRNRYTADNGKYIGAYQFGPSALKGVGLEHISREKWLKNKEIFSDSLQDWAVIEFALKNQKRLSKHINLDMYIGKKIKGVEITRGGILAASHLIGWYNCKKYLQSWGNFNPADGNGTRAHDYMTKFKNHHIYAFDLETDLDKDLSRIWASKKLPSTNIDKIYY